MKKLLIAVALLTSSICMAQQTNYNEAELSRLSKMKLTNIYLDKLNELAFKAPYSTFSFGSVQDSSATLDLPTSKYTTRKRDAIQEMSEEYGKVMRERLYELVPYSDKKDIIRGILFLQLFNSSLKQVK
jgi:hypothetical protein